MKMGIITIPSILCILSEKSFGLDFPSEYAEIPIRANLGSRDDQTLVDFDPGTGRRLSPEGMIECLRMKERSTR
jgi:hypothetical protein